ncbi:NUT family member 2G-like [Saccopteryx bilineata]|uniref:NUT family member 2G-like n=1 Tax=Saccopteryx bilineata TaxID=59482 RepID=UPI00338F5117
MASEGAPAVLVADVTGHPAASMTPFMALPLTKPTTGPAHRPPWEQPLPPLTVEMIVPTLAVGRAQASEGGWFHILPPQAPPSAAQLAPFILPGNYGPQSNGQSWEGGLATSQAKASLDDSKSTYENYERWQRFKVLARRHLPESPDADALSCFLMSALRSLCRLKPTMTLQEGIGQAMQEWHRKNNYDRMFFYDMAAEFMELENKEKQNQKVQWKQENQGLPHPAPPRPDSHQLSAFVVEPQPACTSSVATYKAQGSHAPQELRGTQSPCDIPPEAVQEYMDIMDELEGLTHSATVEPGGEWEEDRKESQKEENGPSQDLDVMSYFNQLCSQEDFANKVLLTYGFLTAKGAYSIFFLSQVEEVFDPHFLAQLLSPEASLDLLEQVETLEQEEGLTPIQGVQAPQTHDAPRLDPSSSESQDSQEAQRHNHSHEQGVSDNTGPPETAFKYRPRRSRADAALSRPTAFAVSTGHQECPPYDAQWPCSAPQGHSTTYTILGPRDASTPRETSLVRESRGPVEKANENEDLPNLAFLLASPKSLLPCTLSLSPVSASGFADCGRWGLQEAAQSQFPQRLGLSHTAPQAPKSRKRKCDQSVTGIWMKRPCSLYGAAASPMRA